jgi:methionyl-tRNA synthetase
MILAMSQVAHLQKHTHKPRRIFIGVAWPYVNGDLHVGHLAGYLLPADIFARFHRFIGNHVLMVSGSDCFGTPITVEADKRGKNPQQIVDEYHPKNVELFKKIGISFDHYTKTTQSAHQALVQDFFVKFAEAGLLYKEETDQYYSPTEKRFLPDRYVEGTCPVCKTEGARSDQCETCQRLLNQGELIKPISKIDKKPVELKPTEHYFINWPQLAHWLKSYVDHASPGWRQWIARETQGWLKEGVKPRAITRDLDWGVPIPLDRLPGELQIKGAEHKRIYVWFDAVIGYLSAAQEWADVHGKKTAWQEWWKNKEAEHYYFMGKDNLVFHTLFWPGQLHTYDESLHLPDVPVINQFLTLAGKKFSKSRGITVDSRYIADTYGVDPVRFHIASITPEQGDADFTWKDFVNKHNQILIANLGNFINRTLTLSKDLDLSGPIAISEQVEETTLGQLVAAKESLESAEFKNYIEQILKLSDFGNKYLARTEPWALKKTKPAEFAKIMHDALYIVVALNALLVPLLPETSQKLSAMLGISYESWPNSADELLKKLRSIKLTKPGPLFSKLEEKVIELENAKLSKNPTS